MRPYGWQKRVTHDDPQKSLKNRARVANKEQCKEGTVPEEQDTNADEPHDDCELCGTKKEGKHGED